MIKVLQQVAPQVLNYLMIILRGLLTFADLNGDGLTRQDISGWRFCVAIVRKYAQTKRNNLWRTYQSASISKFSASSSTLLFSGGPAIKAGGSISSWLLLLQACTTTKTSVYLIAMLMVMGFVDIV